MIDREEDTKYVPIEERTPETITKQINYIILENLWRYVNKSAPITDLYDLLGLTPNAYSYIRKGDTSRYWNLKIRAEKSVNNSNDESAGEKIKQGTKKGHLLILGLSQNVMTGIEMIEVNGIAREDWVDYLKQRYESDKTQERAKAMREMTKKLHLAFSELRVDKKDRKPIDIAYYYFKRGYVPSDSVKDKEMKDLQEVLRKIKPEMISECEPGLRKEIFNELKEKYKWMDIMIKYEKEFLVK